MSKLYKVYPGKCTGCKNCELACSYAHQKDGKMGAPRIHGYNTTPPLVSGIQVVCFQCDKAICRDVCPTKALHRNLETGAIELDHDKCISCKACYNSCPFGNLSISKIYSQPVKCDLCKGSPSCVERCPTGALVFE